MGEAQARLKRVDRAQTYWSAVDVESLIGADHAARAIWQLVEQQPLEAFLKDNKSVEGRAGAERTDPRLLISVWVYGLSLGIGSARELARRLDQEPGLRWLCGDQPINHHTLSDFRVDHGKALDGLFSQVLAAMSAAGLVKLEQLTLDGTKIQTHASGASFRREPTLRERLQQAEQLVEQLQQEAEDEGLRGQRQAARARAAEQRQARLRQALEELEEIRRHKPAGEREQARASMTEPEARIMKTGQGGYAPSYNVQSVTDAAHKIVVDVEVTQQASDQQQLAPALERLAPLCGQTTPPVIVDGGYVTQDSIAHAQQQGVELIGPAQNREQQDARRRKQSLEAAGIVEEFSSQAFRILEEGAALECPAGRRLARISQTARYHQYRAQARDCGVCAQRARCCPKSGARSVKIAQPNAVVEAFQERMRQPACQQLYQLRGAVAEFPHAWWKEKFGLRKFHVRGLAKARIEAKWAALTYNIQQWIRLRWRPQLVAAA